MYAARMLDGRIRLPLTGRALPAAVAVVLLATAHAAADEASDFFERKIRPVLVERCYKCHSTETKLAGKLKGNFLADHRDGLLAGGDSGPAVVPRQPDGSLLIQAIEYDGAFYDMPPDGKLDDGVIADFRRWIELGAVDPRDAPPSPAASDPVAKSDSLGGDHWAFQPPRRVDAPPVCDAAWPETAIDPFILAKLEEQGMPHADDADRHTWLRRVTFDLSGLPPTVEEIEAFVSDASHDAFERVVDRLMASPAFGDRWGRHWLDVAQYADTVSIDRLFPDRGAWRYRDYVIAAFNDDKPFDQFVLEQVAGDLLPAATAEERAENLIATAFLAHGPTQTINQFKEQLRWDIIDNQVSKVGQVFMGLTMQCARCHDHKFDPVSQRDYYALAGIFQNLQMLDGFLGQSKVFSDWVRVPLPETAATRPEHDRAIQAFDEALRAIEHRAAETSAEIVSLERRLAEPMSTRADAESQCGEESPSGEEAQPSALKDRLTAARAALKALETDRQNLELANAPEWPSVFAAHEVAAANARITIRGNASLLGDEVPRGVVAVATIGQPPAIADGSSGRLELARWLVDPQHPLVARVFVNRVWHHLFGAGLVASVDNFGTRGERPSHPELLDYLALQFVEHGWSTKWLIRELVTSRTYRMASDHCAGAMVADPANRLLWRMNRRRLEAEAIRDSVLAIGERLDSSRGGPCLPPSSWLPGAVASYSVIRDEPPPPASVAHRRTIYLPWYRRPPAWADGLMLFGAPIPSAVTGARAASTVPTQALYLMNGPLFIDGSRATAKRLLADAGMSSEDRVQRFYLMALGRPARDDEVARARAFIASATEGGDTADTIEVWAQFCHAVFASNEFLMRL